MKLALVLLFLFATQTWAKGLHYERLQVQAGGATLHGVRYLNADGKPNTGKWVVFTHGLGSTYHAFEYLIPLFMAAGYDCFAFNFRGHGNGAERSRVQDYTAGDYRLEKMASEDFPAMAREAQRRHGGDERGVVVGHSMGGMSPRGSFALGAIEASRIESMILLGSPPHFDSQSVDDWLGIQRWFQSYLFSGRGDSDVQLSLVDPELESLIDLTGVFSIGYYMFKDSLMGLIKGPMGDGLLDVSTAWMDRAMSKRIPKDILRSFADYIRAGYPYKNVAIPVPILHIMGERDQLVKHADISAHASVQSQDAGYWLAKVNGVGHLGLVMPKAIEVFRQTLFEFLQTDGELGSSHRSYFELARSCERRLSRHEIPGRDN